jgi:hypothetical protein
MQYAGQTIKSYEFNTLGFILRMLRAAAGRNDQQLAELSQGFAGYP